MSENTNALERARDILAHTQAEHRFLVGTVRAAVAAGDRDETDPLLWLRQWLTGHHLYPPPDSEPARLAGECVSFCVKAWTWRCLLCGVYGTDRPASPAAETHQHRWHTRTETPTRKDVAGAPATNEHRHREGEAPGTSRGPGTPAPRENTEQEMPLWT